MSIDNDNKINYLNVDNETNFESVDGPFEADDVRTFLEVRIFIDLHELLARHSFDDGGFNMKLVTLRESIELVRHHFKRDRE